MREKLISLIEETGMVENKNRCRIIAEELIFNGLRIPVRCKECRWAREKDHREPTDTPMELICQCFKHHYIPAPWGARMAVSTDDFCSYGERKDNEYFM